MVETSLFEMIFVATGFWMALDFFKRYHNPKDGKKWVYGITSVLYIVIFAIYFGKYAFGIVTPIYVETPILTVLTGFLLYDIMWNVKYFSKS